MEDSEPLPWEEGTARFFAALKKFDDYLASPEPLHASAEKLFQGPVADSLTHVGQIAMLRRMAGGPVRAKDISTPISSRQGGRGSGRPEVRIRLRHV